MPLASSLPIPSLLGPLQGRTPEPLWPFCSRRARTPWRPWQPPILPVRLQGAQAPPARDGGRTGPSGCLGHPGAAGACLLSPGRLRPTQHRALSCPWVRSETRGPGSSCKEGKRALPGGCPCAPSPQTTGEDFGPQVPLSWLGHSPEVHSEGEQRPSVFLSGDKCPRGTGREGRWPGPPVM